MRLGQGVTSSFDSCQDRGASGGGAGVGRHTLQASPEVWLARRFFRVGAFFCPVVLKRHQQEICHFVFLGGSPSRKETRSGQPRLVHLWVDVRGHFMSLGQQAPATPNATCPVTANAEVQGLACSLALCARSPSSAPLPFF